MLVNTSGQSGVVLAELPEAHFPVFCIAAGFAKHLIGWQNRANFPDNGTPPGKCRQKVRNKRRC